MVVYYRWVRWCFTEALAGRSVVFVNMDETTLSQVQSASQGFVPSAQVQRDHGMIRARRRPDRLDVRTCLLGTVCNDATVQPHLPQVILPAYTKHVRPPARALDAYRQTRSPLEYWHGTNGWTSQKLIRRWLTRLRAVVAAAKAMVWIVVIWDCASVHLHPTVLRHMRRLGMLVIFIPAGLTHLLQVLDVFIFADLKRRMRDHFLRRTYAEGNGYLESHHRIDAVGRAVHEALVQVRCEDFFQKVGLGAALVDMNEDIFNVIGTEPIAPALPNRAEFATLTGAASHTPRTAAMHSLSISGWLQLRARPVDAAPPIPAVVALPPRAPARPRDNGLPQEHPLSIADVRMRHLRRRHDDAAHPVPDADGALNIFTAD